MPFQRLEMKGLTMVWVTLKNTTKMVEIEAKQRKHDENAVKMWQTNGRGGIDLWPVAISVSAISKT